MNGNEAVKRMGTQYHDDLNRKLFEAVPELRPIADSKLDYWEDEEPNSHVVYGDVLADYLKSTDIEKDADPLRQAFDLLEELAHRPQGSTAYSVLMTEVLHAIMAPNEEEDPDEVLEWLREVRKRYMGKETRRLARLRAGVFKPEYMDKCRRALGKY